MFDFYERRKIKQWLYSWSFLAVLFISSTFIAHGVWGVYQKERQTRINKNQQLTYLEGLKVRQEALEEEITGLNTERGIEEEIRQKFEVAKEGENVIVIVESPVNRLLVDIKKNESIFKKLLGAVLFWK